MQSGAKMIKVPSDQKLRGSAAMMEVLNAIRIMI
jgi:hypothetical protein